MSQFQSDTNRPNSSMSKPNTFSLDQILHSIISMNSHMGLLLLLLLVGITAGKPLMIEQKEEFLSLIRTKTIAVIFYGETDTEEYLAFSQAIPTSDRLFAGIEFLYVPASKFKLNRPSPSISLFRRIGEGDWLLYRGAFSPSEIDRWVRRHVAEQLSELTAEELQRLFREERRGLIVLDFGEFQLIRSKIYLQEFCEYQKVSCFKLTPKSPLFNVGLKLMGIPREDDGISRIAFYNPRTQRVELYPKDAWFITREELLELYEGREGIVEADKDGRVNDVEIQLHYEEI